MRRTTRTAAALSALTLAAGGLVTVGVVMAPPALAACVPGESGNGGAQPAPGGNRRGQNQQAAQGDAQTQADQQARNGQDQQTQDGQGAAQGDGQQAQGNQQAARGDAQAQGAQQDQQGQNRQGRNGQRGQDNQGQDNGQQAAQGDAQGQQTQNGQDQQPQNGQGAAQGDGQQAQDDQQAVQGDAQAQGQRAQQRGQNRQGRGRGNNGGGGNNNGGNNGGGAGGVNCDAIGPAVGDFVDIRQVRASGSSNLNGNGGSFTSRCGTNANGHLNPDNFIVAPGVSNGAQHLHDYVGNLSTDAFSTDESLSAAGTTCGRSDKSTYFWPVIRDRRSEENANSPEGNVGRVLRPRQATMLFRGTGETVTAMPRFLRVITGDAKAVTNGPAQAKAQWTCSGFTNRITTKYPICPRNSQVMRILDFPNCWDGQNTDSANHRTHIVFPQNGRCPQGTKAVPQLRMILSYSVGPGTSYAVDAFPEEKHNPITDHADFANLMPDNLMSFMVSCINRGRRC